MLESEQNIRRKLIDVDCAGKAILTKQLPVYNLIGEGPFPGSQKGVKFMGNKENMHNSSESNNLLKVASRDLPRDRIIVNITLKKC